MKRPLVAVALAWTLAGCAPAHRDPGAIEARPGPLPGASTALAFPNAGFENAALPDRLCPHRWYCVTHSDPRAFAYSVVASADAPEGKQAACVERVKPEPWTTLFQMVSADGMRGARVRVSVDVRIDPESTGGVQAGTWITLRGPSSRLVGLHQAPVAATAGWQRLSVEAPVGPETDRIEFGATVLGGGRACFDDVRLEILR